jgi:hypothetical protein
VAYGREVQAALVLIRKAFNCQCGKLLASFLRSNIDTVVKESKFNVTDNAAAKLKKISARPSAGF